MLTIKEACRLCRACYHYNKSIGKCDFYLRPCSTLKLWKGDIEPPEQCPNKEQFENP